MRLVALTKDERASAAAELALILPALAFVILNVVDFSVYLYSRMQVDLAAQEAVGAARVLSADDTVCALPATKGSNCPTLNATMTSAAQTTSLGSNVTIGTPDEAYFCATTGGELAQVASVDATVPDDCSATVSGSTATPGDYISVTASYNFSPVFPGASIASVLPSTITRTAWMRLE